MPVHARSPLQFAVVREDPRVEAALIDELRCRRVLLVGSGGCTALALRASHPELEITLIEPNPAQVAHLERKLAALADLRPAAFNVGDDSPEGLCGKDRLVALSCKGRGFCGGPCKVLTFLTDPAVVRRILAHLGLPTEPPHVAPARPPPQTEIDFS